MNTNVVLIGIVIGICFLVGGTLAFAQGQASKSKRMVTFLLIMGAVASLTPIMIQHFANPDHLTTSLGLTIVGSFGGYALVIYHCMRKSAARAFPWSLQVGIGMMVVSYIYVLTEVSRIAMNNPMPTIQ